MKRLNSSQGIALIQVLLITAILSVLALYLTNTAKNQVKIAQWTNDKMDAQILLHSTENQLMFSLLTQSKEQNESVANELKDNIAKRWNFFSKPFNFNDQVLIAMQDQAGLINAHYPNATMLKQLLLSQAFDETRVNEMVDSLLDWQDLDSIPRIHGEEFQKYNGTIRNGAVPYISDFKFIRVISPQALELLLKTTTIYRQGSFNPLTAPVEILTAITDKNISDQIVKLRESGELSKTNFKQLTGIVEDDDTFFYPSNILSITLFSTVGESNVKKERVIQLAPYASDDNLPINILSTRG